MNGTHGIAVTGVGTIGAHGTPSARVTVMKLPFMNSDTTLFYNTTFVPNVTGWQTSLAYLNPRVVRLNAEFAW